MTRQEKNAVLAGLRLLQRMRTNLPEGILEIFCDGKDNDETLSNEAIDALCDFINRPEPEQYDMLAVGGLDCGFRFIGPFNDSDSALDYATEHFDQYTLVELGRPDTK